VTGTGLTKSGRWRPSAMIKGRVSGTTTPTPPQSAPHEKPTTGFFRMRSKSEFCVVVDGGNCFHIVVTFV
jgi:hypothetical protein